MSQPRLPPRLSRLTLQHFNHGQVLARTSKPGIVTVTCAAGIGTDSQQPSIRTITGSIQDSLGAPLEFDGPNKVLLQNDIQIYSPS